MSKKIKLPKRNRKNFPYKLVMVWWEDIISDSSWEDIIEIKKANTSVCCSVGWLMHTDSVRTIVMAAFSWESDGSIKQGGCYTTIPTKNVIKTKQIKI